MPWGFCNGAVQSLQHCMYVNPSDTHSRSVTRRIPPLNSAPEPSRRRIFELLEHRRVLASAGAAITFQLPEYLSLGSSAQVSSAQLGDIDADGIADLVVTGTQVGFDREADLAEPFLSVLFGNGSSFAERIDSSIPLSDIALADFDFDGTPEIAGLDSNDEWVVLDWDATEKAAEQSPFTVSDSPFGLSDLVSLSDFNLDGVIDFLSQEDSEIVLRLGHEDVESESISTSVFLSETATRQNVAVVDLDADGDLDIAAPCDECGEEIHLAFWLNDGLGEFALSESYVPLNNVELGFLRSADVDSDGRIDLVLGLSEITENGTQHSVSALRQTEEGTFEESYSVPFDQSIASIHLDDVTSNGVTEIIVKLANGGPTKIVVSEYPDGEPNQQVITQSIGADDELIGVAGGSFVSVSAQIPGRLMALAANPSATGDEIDLFETAIYPNRSHFLDINDDGSMDVVGLSEGGISYLVGQERGTFESLFMPIDDIENYTLQVGNFDTSPGSELVLVGHLIDGSGTVLRRLEIVDGQPTQTEVLSTQRGIVIATDDMDNDGLLDFVFRSDFVSENRSSSVLLNRGGTWLERTLSVESGTVAIEDLDGDGTLEAYVFEDPIRIFKYQDDDFVFWGEIPKGTTRAQVLDLNADGLKDFVSIQKQGGINNVLTAFVANGDGTWQRWEDVWVTDYEFSDTNGDSLIDIVSPRHFFVSAGDGTWATSDELQSESPVWAESNRYVDVNGDGIVDNAKLHLNAGVLDLHVSEGSSWITVDSIATVGEFELYDLNGDGLSDLLQTEGGSLTVNYRSEGGWTEPFTIADDIRDYFVVDYDENDLRDIVVVYADTFSSITQVSQGEFVADVPVETGPTTVEDVNGDGILDLKLVETDALMAALQSVVWFGSDAGLGSAEIVELTQPETQWLDTALWLTSTTGDAVETRLIATSLSSTSIDVTLPRTVADIDNDGDLDVYIMSPDGLLVFYGRGEGDFDGNGKIEPVDADLLRIAISREDTDARFDVNADGELNEEDVAEWIQVTANTTLGDADLDGSVQFNDFLKFSLNFGVETTNWSDGDFDGDGVVSFTDFLALSRFFGSSRLS